MGFEIKDLVNVLSHKIHIDEFSSNVGNDEDNVVISFLVNDRSAASDLVDFFEIGYDFVIDADVSESEIIPGHYLVFVEIERRRRFVNQLYRILSDLRASSGINKDDYVFRFMNEEDYLPVTPENIYKNVPLSPHAYKELLKKPINEFKQLAGIAHDKIISTDPVLFSLQQSAGIYTK